MWQCLGHPLRHEVAGQNGHTGHKPIAFLASIPATLKKGGLTRTWPSAQTPDPRPHLTRRAMAALAVHAELVERLSPSAKSAGSSGGGRARAAHDAEVAQLAAIGAMMDAFHEADAERWTRALETYVEDAVSRRGRDAKAPKRKSFFGAAPLPSVTPSPKHAKAPSPKHHAKAPPPKKANGKQVTIRSAATKKPATPRGLAERMADALVAAAIRDVVAARRRA